MHSSFKMKLLSMGIQSDNSKVTLIVIGLRINQFIQDSILSLATERSVKSFYSSLLSFKSTVFNFGFIISDPINLKQELLKPFIFEPITRDSF